MGAQNGGIPRAFSHYARRYMSNGMIHVQRSFCEFALDVNKSRVSTFDILLSYRRRQWKYQQWNTVQRYGKYHRVYLIPLKQFSLERSDRLKMQNSPSVDHRCQNASEKHIPSVDPTFSLLRTWSRMYQASSHTNRSMHCLWLDAQRILE